MEKRKEYILGDMAVYYEWNEAGNVGLILYPADCPLSEMDCAREWAKATERSDCGDTEPEMVSNILSKQAALDPLVQVKLCGDMYQGAFAPGHTMRMGESTRRLVFESQKIKNEGEKTVIETVLKDDRGYQAVHRVCHQDGDRFLTVDCTYVNNSKNQITLEMLSSFSLNKISPYLPGDCYGDITVHRLQSRWSEEGKLLSQTMEDLQLEPGWNMDSVRSERFGQVGSMPVSQYFPFLALEDTRNHIFWGGAACASGFLADGDLPQR